MGIKMRKYSLFYLLFGPIVFLSCAQKQEDLSAFEANDYSRRVGWVDGDCLAIQNAKLSAGSEITVVVLDELQYRIVAKVLGEATDGETCFPLLGDRRSVNVGSGYSFYQIKSDKKINFAIAVTEGSLASENYSFDYCSTLEGISFSVKKANQNTDEEIWNGYYYLGYDAEATCDIESNE